MLYPYVDNRKHHIVKEELENAGYKVTIKKVWLGYTMMIQWGPKYAK
jgi:hypothetical protein